MVNIASNVFIIDFSLLANWVPGNGKTLCCHKPNVAFHAGARLVPTQPFHPTCTIQELLRFHTYIDTTLILIPPFINSISIQSPIIVFPSNLPHISFKSRFVLHNTLNRSGMTQSYLSWPSSILQSSQVVIKEFNTSPLEIISIPDCKPNMRHQLTFWWSILFHDCNWFFFWSLEADPLSRILPFNSSAHSSRIRPWLFWQETPTLFFLLLKLWH